MATVTSLGLPVPDEDLCHLVWRAPAWLSEQAASHAAPPSSTFGVTPSNALEYFSLSPFFDRRSTNQTLMMQTMYSNQAPLDHARMAEELKRFVGVEYALLDGQSSEGAFVIEKRYRQDPATSASRPSSLKGQFDAFEISLSHCDVHDPQRLNLPIPQPPFRPLRPPPLLHPRHQRHARPRPLCSSAVRCPSRLRLADQGSPRGFRRG